MRTFFKNRRPDMRDRPVAPDADMAASPFPGGGPSMGWPARTGGDPLRLDAIRPERGRVDRRLMSPSPEPDDLPRFSLPVSDGIRTPSAHSVSGISREVSQALREAFTPTRPKQEINGLFIGRLSTLRRIISVIEEERAHVVLHGDRGRGKTSLANAVERIAAQAGYMSVRMTCSAELAFEEMFRNLLRRIPISYRRGTGDNPFSAARASGSFEDRLPQGAFSVTELAEALDEIAGTHVLIVLDEYDRVVSEDTKNKLAELIKNLTDNGSSVTLFIIGVAENVDELLGKHPSIQRSLVAVHLPPMSDREIERIVIVGGEAAGLGFSADVRQRIVSFSKGLPYYAQLLSLHAARAAVGRDSRQVERRDFADAVRRCAAEAERGLLESYHEAVGPSDEEGEVADVLYLCAQAPFDDYGTIRESELVSAGDKRRGQPALPPEIVRACLERLCAGQPPLLERVIVPSGHRIRFCNQMMRQFIILMQAERRNLL